MEMKEKNSVTVSISGRNYVLSTDEGEGLVLEAASRVDVSMKSILSGVNKKTSAQAAILVALRLSLDLIKAEKLELNRDEKVQQMLSLVLE